MIENENNDAPSSETRVFVSIHRSGAWGLDMIRFTASVTDFSDPVSPAQECKVFPKNESGRVCGCVGEDDTSNPAAGHSGACRHGNHECMPEFLL